MVEKPSFRILVVDDHPLIRFAVTHVLKASKFPLQVVTACNQAEAANCLRSDEIDLAIVDISLPDGSGLELISQQHCSIPSPHWLVLSLYNEPFHRMQAQKAGAVRFLSKSTLESDLVDAVDSILSGTSTSVDVSDQSRLPSSARSDLGSLSEREMTVFRMIAEGNTVEQIATSLERSPKTINALRDRIRAKLSIGSSNELNRFATWWFIDQAESPPITRANSSKLVADDQFKPS